MEEATFALFTASGVMLNVLSLQNSVFGLGLQDYLNAVSHELTLAWPPGQNAVIRTN